jgi:membrane-associated protease RseP (regulator of RpoE activity)
MNQLAGFIWFVLMLAPLIFLQRLLHRELQAVFLIATRSARFTIGLFQLIFLPGVFLHESSHYLMAKILRVPTGRFSVLRARCLMGGFKWDMWRSPSQTSCATRSSARRP